MKCIQRRRDKFPPGQKWSLVSLGPCDWLMGGIFAIVLKWQKNEKIWHWPSDQHVTSFSRKPCIFFQTNAYIQGSQAYFIKYIRSKQMLSIPFACEILIVQAHWYIFWNGLPFCVFSQKFSVTAPVSGRFQTWFPYSFILTGFLFVDYQLGMGGGDSY